MAKGFNLKVDNSFTYIEEGEGEVILLLHGLFGALSNWKWVLERFSSNYKVVIPMLPIYDMPVREAGLEGLVGFIREFVKWKKFDKMVLMGNSLGGHVALLYALENQDKVTKLVLTGSSGLFENSMGGSFPKRGSYDYIKERVEYTFFNPKTATKELVDEVFETTKSIPKCLRIVSIAKSAQRNNLSSRLPELKIPTLLVWGLNDTITPPMVAHDFHRLLPNSKLRFLDECSHAPMMEHPEKFNDILQEFL
jgi:pimeloyl-ACP methyl ester carboxylesterase